MRTLLTAAIVLCLCATARAAEPTAPPEKVHRVERLGDHSFVIFGRGGNVGLFVGDREAVLVDTQIDKLAQELFEVVATVTNKPLKLLINTHYHLDHVGGNPLFAPRVGGIVAHANVPPRVEKDQAKVEPSARGGLPTLLMGEADPSVPAHLAVRSPGLALEVVHRLAAHTDGDVTVEAPADHVIHMGDLFFNGLLPFVDIEGGGSLDGLADTVAAVAATAPDDVRVIPGHGPLCGKKELVRYRDFLAAVRDHARAHPAWTSHELADRFDKAAWPEWKPNPTFVTWETLFDAATRRGPGRIPRKT